MTDEEPWLPASLDGLGIHESYTIPGGRHVSYARFGDRSGDPVLACHGTPGSRWFGAIYHDVAVEQGYQVITIERPGIGRSSSDPDRSIGTWASDVEAIAEYEGWEQFPVIGFAGGAPYALDCAVGLADRVPRVALVAALGPPAGPQGGLLDRLLGLVARTAPGLGQRLFSIFADAASDDSPEEIAGSLTAEPVLDQTVADGATVAQVLTADLLGAMPKDTAGVVQEFALASQSWTFDLDEVSQPVACWHGTEDNDVPVAATRYLEEQLPNCSATILDGEDHGSTLVRTREEVFEHVLDT